MRIRVKLFAVLRDRAGTGELELNLPEGTTVAGARDAICSQIPSLHDSLHRIAFAVNLSYAGVEAVLHDGDELALLPPVSGG